LSCPVDGKDVGSFSEGRSYSGYLSAGQHVITARADPHQPGARPGRKNRDCTSWTHLLLYRSLVGRESGFSKKSVNKCRYVFFGLIVISDGHYVTVGS